MPDREKVIHALETCIRDDFATAETFPCRECDYFVEVTDDENYDCMGLMIRDAIALLREQEPRVMTLEEVKAFDWDYCYLEEERLPGKEYRAVCGDYALTCITWPCITSMRIQHGDDSYGRKWRCWTAKPTDEQREAVK